MLQQITVFDDGASLSPVKLTRGDRNQLRFLINRPDINPSVLMRPYAAITRLGQLLALTTQNITFAIQPDGLLAIELGQIELNTAEIQKFTLDYRPDTAKPDIDGEFTFCRANLEIGGFDSLTADETCLLFNVPVEIHHRNYFSGEFVPTPRESFYTKAETDQKIAEAVSAQSDSYTKTETDQKIQSVLTQVYTRTVTDQKLTDAVTGALQSCREEMETVLGAYLTQYEEVLNGKFL